MVVQQDPNRLSWQGGGSTRCWAFVAVVLVASSTFAFWPVAGCGFLGLDDPQYVTANPHVQGGLTWNGLRWAFTAFHASNWHPLTWLSHMLDAQLFGKSAAGPHLVNLLLHVSNTLLLFCLLRRLTDALWRAALVAALFALHPLRVESVAWIAERKDVLYTFFYLASWLLYINYVKGRRRGYYIFSLLLFEKNTEIVLEILNNSHHLL